MFQDYFIQAGNNKTFASQGEVSGIIQVYEN